MKPSDFNIEEFMKEIVKNLKSLKTSIDDFLNEFNIDDEEEVDVIKEMWRGEEIIIKRVRVFNHRKNKDGYDKE